MRTIQWIDLAGILVIAFVVFLTAFVFWTVYRSINQNAKRQERERALDQSLLARTCLVHVMSAPESATTSAKTSSISPETEARTQIIAARTLLAYNRGRRDILPRRVYELVGEPVPEGATDEHQIIDDPAFDAHRKTGFRGWWQRNFGQPTVWYR